jgi:hypothetical protein
MADSYHLFGSFSLKQCLDNVRFAGNQLLLLGRIGCFSVKPKALCLSVIGSRIAQARLLFSFCYTPVLNFRDNDARDCNILFVAKLNFLTVDNFGQPPVLFFAVPPAKMTLADTPQVPVELVSESVQSSWIGFHRASSRHN